jgi:hypothetical protein
MLTHDTKQGVILHPAKFDKESAIGIACFFFSQIWYFQQMYGNIVGDLFF